MNSSVLPWILQFDSELLMVGTRKHLREYKETRDRLRSLTMTKKKTPKKKKGYGRYRSGLVRAFAEALPRGSYEYESVTVPYSIQKKYLVDFIVNGVKIECKGFFRVGDTQKYKAIRDALEAQGETLVFLLSDPNKKIRKGAKMTMGQWCTKEGFPWFTMDTIEELLEYVNQNT